MSDWLVWQVVDSAFPTGTFAHSWGLEAAWQQGGIETPAALEAFVRASAQQAAYAAIPLVNAAYCHPGRLEALDELAEAFLLNAVANRASRIQGRTLVTTACRVWPSDALHALAGRTQSLHAHAAPLTGAVFRAIDLPLATVQRVVLHATARGVLSAAVRLGIVGSYEAQRMQYACGSTLDCLAARCADLDETDLVQTAPVIDLLQAAHDRLYSRLFQS
jgi:urease accessory protein